MCYIICLKESKVCMKFNEYNLTLDIALELNAYARRTGPETDSIEQRPLRGRDSYILLLFFSNLLKMSENNLCFLGLVEKIITPLLTIG